MGKFPQMRCKHTNSVQLPAIFNQTTSLQWSYSLVLVHQSISIFICNAKTFKIVLQVSWQPPLFSFFFSCIKISPCFIHNEWVNRLLFKCHTVMHFSLSSSSTCCDTDLERSSCCRPEGSSDKKAAFKFAQKGEEAQVKMLSYKNKKALENVNFYICCASTERRVGCGSLWLPERELPPVKGDMMYLYFDHWHRGGGTWGAANRLQAS